ncbi:carboxylesterase family protein [Mycolicibacterium sp. 3033]|nr:carboxylesterase family protein [Mycolicibacterium aurantiacum]
MTTPHHARTDASRSPSVTARLLACAAAALAVLGGTAPVAHAAGTVELAQGAVRGVTDGQVTSYRGIPFAAPPTGELRWRPPAPPVPWEGTVGATEFGPSCIQGRYSGQQPVAQSEDCLTANVWTPAGTPPGANLPVMVWIYGGGFSIGSSALPDYDGTNFAERGVVLVSFNYRLGRLGYFAHPALTAENPGGELGNYGLMDAIAALEWVQANIASFGGDPGNVTIFGESAGGMTVNYLMTSPRSQGLFAKAISQSGFNRMPMPPIRGGGPASGEDRGAAFAESLGITGSGPGTTQALRDLPAETVIGAGQGDGDRLSPTMPTLDGTLLVENPFDVFAAGREAKVPFIVGGTSWEASLVEASRTDPEGTLARLGPRRDDITSRYPGDVGAQAADVTTDMLVTEPARDAARMHSAHGIPTYAYYFDYVPVDLRDRQPGTPHAGEIVYVFDTLQDRAFRPGGRDHPPATDEDRRMADVAITYWSNFARTGAPGSVAGVDWPTFTPDDTFLRFGPVGPQAVAAFRRQQLDALVDLPPSLRVPAM